MDNAILTPDEVLAMIPKLQDRNGFNDGLYICKSGPMAGSFATDVISEPIFDQAAMSVRVKISTPSIDRVHHTVNQSGIRTDLYQENPVVLFGHGMEGIVFPVAISETPDGVLTIEKGDDSTFATAYHNASLKFSSQMFDMVVQKFLRAASVGITPISCSRAWNPDGEEVLVINECYLNEWSYCRIGVNPTALVVKKSHRLKEFLDLQCDAANRILTLNKLDGAAIHPVIRKSLQACVTVQASTPGIEKRNDEVSKIKLNLAQVKKMKPIQLAKAMTGADGAEYDDETKALLKSALDFMGEDDPSSADVPASGDDSTATDPESVLDEPDVAGDPSETASSLDVATDSSQPLGAQVLTSIYGGLNSLIDTATQALAPVEAHDVKAAANDVLAQIRDLATSLEGVFSKNYPDQDPLSPPADTPDDEVVKSWLANSARGRDQVNGLAARIAMVHKACKGGKISAGHTKLLARTVEDMRRVTQVAKSFKVPAKNVAKATEQPAGESVEAAEIKAAFAEIKKQFKSLVETLQSTPAPIG